MATAATAKKEVEKRVDGAGKAVADKAKDAAGGKKGKGGKIAGIVGGGVVAAAALTMGVLLAVPQTRKKICGTKDKDTEEEASEALALAEEAEEAVGIFGKIMSWGNSLYP